MTPREIQAWAREAVSDPDYLESVRTRLVAGALSPTMEELIVRLAVERPTVMDSLSHALYTPPRKVSE